MLVKQLFDLDSWVVGSKMVPGLTFAGTRNRFWELVGASNAAEERAGYEKVSIELPMSFRNPRKSSQVLSHLLSPCRAKSPSLAKKMSSSSLRASYSLTLNSHYCLSLTGKPTLHFQKY